MVVSEWELLLRLALSCVLGGVIGYERQSRRKSAGLRTNILVCLGSCLIMVLSESIYHQVEGLTNADPARLAAQVVSGIGFLGAGTIMKEGPTVKGLTTAACLWVVAGVGLAVGAGYYSGALFASALVFATLGTLSKLDDWVTHEKNMEIAVAAVDLPGIVGRVGERLAQMRVRTKGVRVKSGGDDTVLIMLNVYNSDGVKNTMIAERIKEIEGVVGVDVE